MQRQNGIVKNKSVDGDKREKKNNFTSIEELLLLKLNKKSGFVFKQLSGSDGKEK